MKNAILIAIQLLQWLIALILVFLAYGGLQGDDLLIPVILLVVAVLIIPPVTNLMFGRKRKKNASGK